MTMMKRILFASICTFLLILLLLVIGWLVTFIWIPVDGIKMKDGTEIAETTIIAVRIFIGVCGLGLFHGCCKIFDFAVFAFKVTHK